MNDIVDFPHSSRGIPDQVSAEELGSAPQPTDRQVWAVCPYVNGKDRCAACPDMEEDPDYGPIQRGCRGLAEEAARAVMAAAPASSPG